MTEHQASRAEHQDISVTGAGPADRLLGDVIEVPRDKDAKRLVEAIRKATIERPCDNRADWAAIAAELNLQLGTIHGLAIRLAVLLDERDAATEEPVAAGTGIAGLILGWLEEGGLKAEPFQRKWFEDSEKRLTAALDRVKEGK